MIQALAKKKKKKKKKKKGTKIALLISRDAFYIRHITSVFSIITIYGQ
jgi:predicted transcriptional regulator